MRNKSFLVMMLGVVLATLGKIQAKTDSFEPQKPWSVRMAESEMVRNPESWQLDFQPLLSWAGIRGYVGCVRPLWR